MKKLPTSPRPGQPRLKQQGYALIVLLALLTGAAATVAVKVINNGSSTLARDKITAAALAQAKDALIGRAITYAETHPGEVHGYLPCPDISGTAVGGEGAAEGVCGAQDVSVIGRLPWKTLNLPPLRGGDGECLWYAVSGTYKNNPPTGLMNWDTNGQLQVYASDGTTLLTPSDNQAVAVIIAPGSTTDTQNRSGSTTSVCGGNYTASNYLDTVGTFNNAAVSSTAKANSAFRIGNPASPSGDRIAFITRKDLWNVIKRRQDFLATLDTMTKSTAECISGYGNKNALSDNHSLPWPTRLTLSDYGNTANYYDKKNLYAGRVPYQVDISRLKTGNTISNDYLLTQCTIWLNAEHTHCISNNCPVPDDWAAIYPWWYNWKEHLFYAVSQRFKPGNSSTNSTCDSDHQCLRVNSSGNYAAVVIFAGKNLSDPIRTDKSIISNYLEGRNNSNMASFANGNENYQAETATIPPSTTFNDIVYCIKEDLSVVKGTAAGCP